MKCILILYCTLSYSSLNCVKSSPVKDTVFEEYYPISLSSNMKYKNDDNLQKYRNPGKGNVFDAVRKHYELYNVDNLVKYSPETKKYNKNLVFNKAKYTKTIGNEVLCDLDSYITTTVSYIPVGDMYVDIDELSNNDDGNVDVEKRYLSDLMLSEMRAGNNFYKHERVNEFSGNENDLDMHWAS